MGAGTFGVVLLGELRGSTVALKSLRTGAGSFGTMGMQSTAHTGHTAPSGGTSTGASMSTAGRRGGAFAFIDAAFSQVQDEERRGLLRLQRAFRLATREVTAQEANARDKDNTHANSVVAGIKSK